ncbi:SepA family multidrug efflux transporter [Macrococcus capreoli]|uniref:SepA family multidrug efflux transporter n=1 Tax=Macrococcus capreoli TaxID=2982690 RepID=UPI0021D5B5CC|nr:SepA family multidrug efflux transporter [Macrococcus sp. TMW 2.2395]MCU7557750.1 SepA family multidrug efflux transporter [Macrococcus sp. TMW 2.2395]
MKPFKFNKGSLFTILFVLSVVLISGGAFILMLIFGMYGLSRILIYLNLAEFTYNENVIDNSFYYGSYIAMGYFLLVVIEYILDDVKRMYSDNKYFQGWYFHILTVGLSTIVFYFGVHINYQHIRINFLVIFIVISVLYYLTEIFYPDSKDLNNEED